MPLEKLTNCQPCQPSAITVQNKMRSIPVFFARNRILHTLIVLLIVCLIPAVSFTQTADKFLKNDDPDKPWNIAADEHVIERCVERRLDALAPFWSVCVMQVVEIILLERWQLLVPEVYATVVHHVQDGGDLHQRVVVVAHRTFPMNAIGKVVVPELMDHAVTPLFIGINPTVERIMYDLHITCRET